MAPVRATTTHRSTALPWSRRSIAGPLMSVLDEDCPDGYDVTQAVEVRINRTRCFIPDEPFPINLPISRITPRSR